MSTNILLDPYIHQDELRNALIALVITTVSALAYTNDQQARVYQDGFRAALVAIGASFGIQLPSQHLAIDIPNNH